MYIVHPKISDEIPAYVDPDLLEYDTVSNGSRTLNIVEPSKGGVFWREYLYSHTEEKPMEKVRYFLYLGTAFYPARFFGMIKKWKEILLLKSQSGSNPL